MQISLLAGIVMIAAVAHPAEGVSQTIPSIKPLFDLAPDRFVEGVDVPPAKPEPAQEHGLPALAPVTSGSECLIPAALVRAVTSRTVVGRNGCGIVRAIEMTGVQADTALEVNFSAPVTVSCKFAAALAGWLVEDVASAAKNHFASDLVEVTTGPGYQCRRRNNKPDGKLSEHALGKAVDISAFKFRSGARVSVRADWAQETREGRFLREIHKAACKRFTTVLGPDADPNHKSHFHLDIGCHGKACTYLICQ